MKVLLNALWYFPFFDFTYEFDPSLYAPRLYSVASGEQKGYANEFRKIVIEEPWEWEAFEEY